MRVQHLGKTEGLVGLRLCFLIKTGCLSSTVKCCSLMILLFSGCPTFHPVSVVSPLNVSQFTLDLAEHPNRQAVNYVLEGLEHGFRLGFQPARRLRSEPPTGINLQPSRTPISLTNIWPTKWLDLGLQALLRRSPCLTYI